MMNAPKDLEIARLHSILDMDGLYIIRTDINGNYTYGNKTFLRTFVANDDFIGKSGLTHIIEEDHHLAYQTVLQCLEVPGKVVSVYLRKPSLLGAILWTKWEFMAIVDDDGNPTEIQCVGLNLTKEKELEQKQEEAQEEIKKLSLIAEETINGVIIADAEGKVVWVNHAFTNISGYTIEEIKGQKPGAFLQGKDTNPHTKEIMSQALRNEQPFDVEILNYKKDGTPYWLRVQCQPLRKNDGTLSGFFAVETDITEQRTLVDRLTYSNNILASQAEELLKTKDMLEMAHTLSLVGSWEYDIATNVLSWDTMTKQIHEVEDDYIPNVNDAIEFYKDDGSREKITKLFEDIVKNNTEYDADFRIITAKKREKWVRTTGKFNSTIINKVYGSIQDITEQKLLELRLRESEQILSAYFNSTTEAVFLVDKDYRILSFNKLGAESIRRVWNKDIVLGDSLLDYSDPSLKDLFVENINTAFQGHSIESEREIPFPNFIRYWHIKYMPIRNNENNIFGVAFVASDITEKKNIENALIRSESSLKKAQKTAKIGSWEFHLHTHNLEWSEEHYRIFELDPNIMPDMLYAAYRSKIHPDDIPVLESCLQIALEKGENFTYHHRVMCNDGTVKYVVGIGEVETINGIPSIVRGTVQDITELTHAQNIVKQERKKYSDIVNSIDGIVWEVNAETFEFTYVSDQAVKLLGYDIEEWYKPNFWTDHIYRDDKDWVVEFCLSQTKQLKPHQFEYRFIAKDGRILWLHDTVAVVHDGKKASFLRGVMIDVTKRKELEQENQELVEKFTSMAQCVPGGLYQFVLQPDGTTYFSYGSSGMYNVFGLPIEKIYEDINNAYNLIRPDYLEKVQMSIQYSAQTMSEWRMEFPVIYIDGSNVWVEGHSLPKKEENGNIVWSGYFQNITERKIKEKELHDRTTLLEKISLLSPMYISVYNEITQTIEYNNKSLVEALGYGEVKQEFIAEVRKNKHYKHHPDDKIPHDEFMKQCYQLKDGDYNSIEYRVLNFKNEWEWLQRKTAVFERDSDGKPIKFINSYMFVTERKKVQLQMEETQERLIMAKKMAQLGTWKYYPKTDTIDLSPYFLLLFGKKSSSNITLTADEFIDTYIHEFDREKVRYSWFEIGESDTDQEKRSIEFRGICDNGKGNHYYSVSQKHLHDCIIGTVQDITERVGLENDLRILNDRLEEKVLERTSELLRVTEISKNITDIVSHDIKNILSGILLQAEMLAHHSGKLSPEKIADYGNNILRSVHDANHLLREMLSIRQSEEGTLTVHSEPVNVSELLMDIGEKNTLRAQLKEISIMYSVEPMTIITDRLLLAEAIENLLSNALKFSPKGSMVLMSVRQHSEYCHIMVKDNGPGINEQEQKLLFSRFTKLSNKPTGGESSTGLGLAITKHLVEQLQGTIFCESSTGKGTSFTIQLPMVYIIQDVLNSTL